MLKWLKNYKELRNKFMKLGLANNIIDE
jgi:hypothetical protein